MTVRGVITIKPFFQKKSLRLSAENATNFCGVGAEQKVARGVYADAPNGRARSART
jgi:hypothetical protein